MNRRKLLKLVAAGLSLPIGFTPLQSLMAAKAVASGRRLVLVELSGANDGLNTLVPITNDHYYRLRPSIGLKQNNVISIDDQIAFHASLKPLMRLWDKGELAWVQGLGYPQPNRSHFASIDLWESGGDGKRAGSSGWLTHDIEHQLGRVVNDAHGISFKGDLNLFNSQSGRWMSLQSVSQIESSRAVLPEETEQYNSTLELVTAKMQELHHTLNSLSAKLQSVPRIKILPGGALGDQLAQVLQLIQAGVDTPVYRVRLDGFDTHDYQLGRHAQLLKQLSASINGFARALQSDGEWGNTLIMTYSEFGRRAAENLSGGTDHGTAAPHLITGGRINGGLYSTAPDLSALINGDPAYTLDYRCVYERVLADWFDIENNQFIDYKSHQLQGLMI